MADDDHARFGPHDLQTPFLFVPHGDPLPLEWMARHPGWVKFPATLVPRRQPLRRATAAAQARARLSSPVATPVTDLAILGMTPAAAAAIPGVLDAYGVGAAAAAGPLLAPELVVPALVVVVIAGVKTYQYMTREQERLLHARPKAPPGTPLPPSLPANPGLVPPPVVPDRPADVGLPQAAPIPDLPDPPHVDPIPPVLSTPASDQTDPDIVHKDRNEGLQGGAKTYTSRARKATRYGNRGVTNTLKDEEWRAHHLFAVAVAKKFPELVAAAVRAGWRMDAPLNMIALPASKEARRKLYEKKKKRLPVHDNRHPDWNERVRKAAQKIVDGLAESKLEKDSAEYDQAARQALEAAERVLRRALRSMTRVTQNDQAPDTAET